MKHIPVTDPHALFSSRRDEILAAITGVADSGRYILGEQTEAFEAEFSAYLGVAHCIGVGSGTDALRLCLMACDIGVGDEVITATHTSVATISAIEQTGAAAVLADIDPATRCIDPGAIEPLINANVRAVIAVHIFGNPADMTAIRNICTLHGLKLIEDCAQAAGASYQGKPVGAIGDMAAFSFYPTKNLPSMGDGGAVTTNDADIASRIRRLRQYGWDRPQHSLEHGINSRLDEIQAAVLRVNLSHLGQDNARRRRIAQTYTQLLEGSCILPPPQSAERVHAWHLYVVEVDQRDELRNFLGMRGIQSALHYTMPIHSQPAYAERRRRQSSFEKTERLYRRMLTIPLYPQMTEAALAQVANGLSAWLDTDRGIQHGR